MDSNHHPFREPTVQSGVVRPTNGPRIKAQALTYAILEALLSLALAERKGADSVHRHIYTQRANQRQ